MRISFLLIFFLIAATKSFSQLELSTGFAVNQGPAYGAPLHIGYDFKLANRFYTKSQLGYKNLYHFDDFVEAKLRTISFELHQTFSYEVIKKRKYILKPNIGVHYKWYEWEAMMVPPLNTLPGRGLHLGIDNNKTLSVRSTSEDYYDTYNVGSPGFSIQLQNQFLIKNRLWMHITPFIEPTYDRFQNTGGCYIGVIYK